LKPNNNAVNSGDADATASSSGKSKEDIRIENPQFKGRYLPQGYADGNPAAIASVETHVRNKLCNSCGKMRDLVSLHPAS
jgi:hypothetical protein